MEKTIKKIKELYMKYKEGINYLIFGFLSFVVCMVTYYICRIVFDYVISNFISWVVAVIFAYVTNKIFVFESKTNGAKKLIIEFSKFVCGRIFTLILETVILYVMVEKMKIDDRIVKVIAQIVVILTNYVLSKLFIFTKNNVKKENKKEEGVKQ